MKKKLKQPRNYHAVNAKFRNSAGSMGDDKKEENKAKCRKEIDDLVNLLSGKEDELEDNMHISGCDMKNCNCSKKEEK